MSGYELETVRVRLVKGVPLYSEKKLDSTEAVLDLMAEELSGYDREVICVLNINAKNKVLNMNLASMGTINASIVSPREIFKSAILANASAVILLHNHPSGVVEPSRADYTMTEQIKKGGEILGIEVLDHIIVGGDSGKAYSIFQGKEILTERPEAAPEPEAASEEKKADLEPGMEKKAVRRKQEQRGPKL